MIWRSAVTLVNARVAGVDGVASSIRFTTRILALDEPPKAGDVVVDVDGAFVLPGFVNAHDHLELNHYGRRKYRERYGNVSEWIADMGPRLSSDPAIRAGRRTPLRDRLFIGMLKNLLSGVTTVAHHNPFYRELRREAPIRVLKRYGWAHSFDLQQAPSGANGERGGDVHRRFRATRSTEPFFVHLAEGVDGRARGEFDRLKAEGCLAANTVIVHGVAIDEGGWTDVGRAGASIVWCPGSNTFLFGQTLDVARAAATASILLGTDSRLTGARDLLDELRIAGECSTVPRHRLLPMITTAAADAIRQPQLGRLTVGAPADLVVVPPVAGNPVDSLFASARRDLALVVASGRPLVGAESFAPAFAARAGGSRPIAVDGARRLCDPLLARRIAGCTIVEPGVAAA